ncbi:MAG: hypothetical protein U7126_05435 [Microcoleus sp.]
MSPLLASFAGAGADLRPLRVGASDRTHQPELWTLVPFTLPYLLSFWVGAELDKG